MRVPPPPLAAGLGAALVARAPAVPGHRRTFGVVRVLLLTFLVLDGVVCAGLVGVGFAFTENILYFGRAFLAGAESGGAAGGIFAAGATFIFRGVLSPFAHPMFTALTGIGLGVAAHTRSGLLRVVAPALGFAGAVLLHALWNLSAVTGTSGFLSSYLTLMAPLFLAGIALVVLLRTRESRLIARALPAYVAAGWLPAYDVSMLASVRHRRAARRWARDRLGGRGERAMADYQRAATELAFLRDRAERLGPDAAFAAREAALLAALAGGRDALRPVLPR